MRLHKKNGNRLMFGVGDRWSQPGTWNGIENPNFLVTDGLVDNSHRQYRIPGRKPDKPYLSGCTEDVGPGKYELLSHFDKSNYRPRSDHVINAGVVYLERPGNSNLIGTMGHCQDRFGQPTVFNGSLRGPDYTSPGLVNKTRWKKFAIKGRPEKVPIPLSSTPEAVGPGTYALPPVFGLHGLRAIERRKLRPKALQGKDDNGHDLEEKV